MMVSKGFGRKWLLHFQGNMKEFIYTVVTEKNQGKPQSGQAVSQPRFQPSISQLEA
jgi:hypothetical protein